MSRTHLIHSLAQDITEAAAARSLRIATAESCTGGLIGAALTDIPGSSTVFECGFTTYSNEAKSKMLGVDPGLIDRFGAVSSAVAQAMAKGALAVSIADFAVSVTGVAGPGGGSPEKPVGLVWFGVAERGGEVRVERRLFADGSRDFVRLKATETALRLLQASIDQANHLRP